MIRSEVLIESNVVSYPKNQGDGEFKKMMLITQKSKTKESLLERIFVLGFPRFQVILPNVMELPFCKNKRNGYFQPGLSFPHESVHVFRNLTSRD